MKLVTKYWQVEKYNFLNFFFNVATQDNLFTFQVEKETFGLKPMNCPGHWYVCLHFMIFLRMVLLGL